MKFFVDTANVEDIKKATAGKLIIDENVLEMVF